MAVKIKTGKALAALNITPLIDVVFLLLIFFLVATRFAEEDRELDVQLPVADEAKPLIAQPSEMFINIDKEGRYFVDGKEMAIDEVHGRLQGLADDANNPLAQSVVIRADRGVALQHAVAVMNLCNKVGIFDYSLTIEGEGG